MTDTEIATQAWWDYYKETVNNDPEMEVRGHDKFDSNFYIEIGEDRFLIQMDRGRIETITPDPAMNHQ